MAIQRPTAEQLQELASRLHISLTPAQSEEYLALMQANFDAYDLVDSLPDEIPEVRYPRAAGYRPTGEENQLNAWYYKTEVKGAATGALAGYTIALKDNISLAGVPMMNGTSTLEGFVPAYDATVATRLLDAGATILGKATCEHFCLSGGSHTSDPAPVHNPHRHGYSAGGSSSGSAALVAAGEVDMAIGCDQGGSIRIPSAFCGTYGMKPTHGLVPYTGIMPIEATIDHAGPITANVRDNALMLEAIAGDDGLDPRQYAPLVETYTSALGKGVRNLKIGILTEGFQLPNMDTQVAAKVRAAVARLQELGAIVGEISVPEHALAGALWSPIGCEGLTAQMMHGNGMGFNWKGQYDVGLLDKHAHWRDSADALSPSLKICMFVGAVRAGTLSWSLLRQGAEYRAPGPRRLRPGTGRLRPAGDAHRTYRRSADTGAGLLHHRIYLARFRNDRQHRPAGHHRSPGHVYPLWHGRRAPGGHDAGRTSLR
ncbi:Amidase [Raoultella terrigena]|uniref:Amidase n=1 Tax=Raoultella terrigena TaxID=577 RepID=A0A485BFM9_RAOTE|nr:Amidase [Raoultella terrigena]